MVEAEARLFDLIDELSALTDDAIPIFPGRIVVNQKELIKIVNAFPNAISDEINDARVILKKKDEILQEAKLRAERIIQDAENERYKLLNESSLNKAMEEHAEKFRQTVFELVAFDSPPDCRIKFFKSVAPRSRKTAIADAIAVFLAGALGLEPRAYGFGDRRSTN